MVFSVCYRTIKDYFEAEDLTQETFLSVYRHYKSFDGNNEKAWICKIAVNKCLDYLKRAERRSQVMGDGYFEALQDKGGTPEEKILEIDTKESIKKLCDNLNEPYRQVALLYYYEEMDIGEIAVKQGKNLKTVQTQYYRAKAMLKRSYGRECNGGTGTCEKGAV